MSIVELLSLAVAVLLWLGAGLLAVPVLVLLFQVVLSLPARRSSEPTPEVARPCVAVLMPAHDEAAGIAASLATVRPQLESGDRLLVVADNCRDDTARIAAAEGAEVVERADATRRGKGYALDFGVRHLSGDPPQVLVIVDADCAVQPGALDRLVRECAASGRPVQALYLMQSPLGAGLKARLGEFAWLVRNLARPLGWHRAGLPCQLMGTGMAFPWPLIRQAPLASPHLVEDLQLGLDLAAAGAPPRFCPEARVTSRFPADAQALATQRARWEHGHLGVIAGQVPKLLWRALSRGKPALATMVLDLAVPPLASLVLMLLAWLLLSGLAAAMGASAGPLGSVCASLALLAVAVLLAWAGHGRHVVGLSELLGAPLYALAKLPVYMGWCRGRSLLWVRTRRDDETP